MLVSYFEGGGLAGRAGSRPGRRPTFLLVQESRQRTPARVSATLRFASGKSVSRNSGCGAAKLAACWRTPLKHVAANLMTMHWHSSVPMPATRTARRRRSQTGRCGRPARARTKLITRLVQPGIAPCAHAFDDGLLWWAVAPQSAISLLRHVFERRAKLEVSFAVQPQEVDGAGCPQAKPEGRGQ